MIKKSFLLSLTWVAARVVDLKASSACLQAIDSCAKALPAAACSEVCDDAPAGVVVVSEMVRPTRSDATGLVATEQAAGSNVAKPTQIAVARQLAESPDSASAWLWRWNEKPSSPRSQRLQPVFPRPTHAMTAYSQSLFSTESSVIATQASAAVGDSLFARASAAAAAAVAAPASSSRNITCRKVCNDERIQTCVLRNVCHEPITVTESWNITHYCLANNGTQGGWAFRVPLAVAVKLDAIQSLVFETELFPATQKDHIIVENDVSLNVSLSEDLGTTPETSVLRHCAIEHIEGFPILAALSVTGLTDNSKKLRFELAGPPPLTRAALIKGDRLLMSITAPMKTLANGGPVPPPFDKTRFTMTHVMNF